MKRKRDDCNFCLVCMTYKDNKIKTTLELSWITNFMAFVDDVIYINTVINRRVVVVVMLLISYRRRPMMNNMMGDK